MTRRQPGRTSGCARRSYPPSSFTGVVRWPFPTRPIHPRAVKIGIGPHPLGGGTQAARLVVVPRRYVCRHDQMPGTIPDGTAKMQVRYIGVPPKHSPDHWRDMPRRAQGLAGNLHIWGALFLGPTQGQKDSSQNVRATVQYRFSSYPLDSGPQ